MINITYILQYNIYYTEKGSLTNVNLFAEK